MLFNFDLREIVFLKKELIEQNWHLPHLNLHIFNRDPFRVKERYFSDNHNIECYRLVKPDGKEVILFNSRLTKER